MQRCEAAIATDNPRIRYRAVQLLNLMELDFVLCHPSDNRCNHCNVVISDVSDPFKHHKGLVLVQQDFDLDYVRIEVMSKLMAIQTPSQVIIGIDPGMTFGIALVVDGIILYQNSLIAPRTVVDLSSRLSNYTIALFPRCHPVVRVGTGSKLYAVLLLRAFLSSSQKLDIELVDEKNTTLSSGPKSDESAAILIAGRQGRSMVSSDLVLEAKAGYIRSIKQFVTRLTRGKQILTSNEARLILLDEKTFDEIVPLTKS